MVSQQVIQGAAAAHGDALRAGEVIHGDRGTTYFIVRADEEDGGAVNRGFDSRSITIIDKRGHAHSVLFHFHQPVLGIIQQSIGICPDYPRDLIAVRVISAFRQCHFVLSAPNATAGLFFRQSWNWLI